MKDELLKWSCHLRENFDKLLALALYMTLFFGVIHISHHADDKDLVGWAKEGVTGAAGAFFILLTGRNRSGSVNADGKPSPPVESNLR